MKPSWIVPQWPAPVGVRALSTYRVGGASRPPYASFNLGGHVGDDPSAVVKNRRSLALTAQLPDEPYWLNQVHGSAVADLDGLRAHNTADAAFTRRRERVCAILTADCLPLLLTSESGDLVAAAHVGWRGLAAGVIEATVAALRAVPETLLAWLGPAIGPRHFEVGPEVRETLLRADPSAHAAFALNTGGRFMADLPALARRRLSAVGVTRIYGVSDPVSTDCTFAAAERFFSHRRDGMTGRQATLIWLEAPEHR